MLIFVLMLVFSVQTSVSADMGPKPFVTVEIIGLEDANYTATLISKEATGPYSNYDEYLEYEDYWLEYDPIMEYEDIDGYRWVGIHWEMQGNGEFSWSYYPPNDFKVLIMTEEGQYYTTNVLERYAFGSYYKVDVSEAINGELDAVIIVDDVEQNYNYSKEIVSFVIRLILTIVIEIGIALLFGFRKKPYILTILIVNLITQIFLNAILNITTYYSGQFTAIALFIFTEFIVLMIELIFYVSYFKTQKSKAVFYTILANLISFVAGFGLYILEQSIF